MESSGHNKKGKNNSGSAVKQRVWLWVRTEELGLGFSLASVISTKHEDLQAGKTETQEDLNLKEGGVGPLSGCVKQSPAPPLDCKRVRNHGACSVGPTTRGLSVSIESTRPMRLHGSPFEVINPAFSVQERHPTLLSF